MPVYVPRIRQTDARVSNVSFVVRVEFSLVGLHCLRRGFCKTVLRTRSDAVDEFRSFSAIPVRYSPTNVLFITCRVCTVPDFLVRRTFDDASILVTRQSRCRRSTTIVGHGTLVRSLRRKPTVVSILSLFFRPKMSSSEIADRFRTSFPPVLAVQNKKESKPLARPSTVYHTRMFPNDRR